MTWMHCNRLDADFEESTCISRRRNAILGRKHSRWSNGKQPVVDPGCKDCDQGKQIAEGKQMESINQVKCERCGGAPPEKRFQKQVRSKTGHMKICTDCFREAISRAKNKGGKKLNQMAREIIDQQNSNPNSIKIDFEPHHDVLIALHRRAAEELRTVENQALYYIKKGIENV